MEQQFEYWDCEGKLVRVSGDGQCEAYRGGGKWETDSSQLHPRSRGKDIGSDFTPVRGAELDEMIKRADKAR